MDKASIQKMTEENLGLVYTQARKFAGTVTFEELVSVGVEALIYSVRGFKPELGNKFSSYAVPSIRRAMGKYCAAQQRFLQALPATADGERGLDNLPAVDQVDELPEDLTGLPRIVAEWRLGLTDGHERKIEDIAAFLGLAVEHVNDVLQEAAEKICVRERG